MSQNAKQYDLEERTASFAREVANFSKQLHRTISNIEYINKLYDRLRQLGLITLKRTKV